MKAAGDRVEASRISERRAVFAKEATRIDEEIFLLEKKEAIATAELNAIISRRAGQTSYMYGVPAAKPLGGATM